MRDYNRRWLRRAWREMRANLNFWRVGGVVAGVAGALFGWWFIEGQYTVWALELDIIMRIVWGGIATLVFTFCLFFGYSLVLAPSLMDEEKQKELKAEKDAREKAEKLLAESTKRFTPAIESRVRDMLSLTNHYQREVVRYVLLADGEVSDFELEVKFKHDDIAGAAQAGLLRQRHEFDPKEPRVSIRTFVYVPDAVRVAVKHLLIDDPQYT